MMAPVAAIAAEANYAWCQIADRLDQDPLDDLRWQSLQCGRNAFHNLPFSELRPRNIRSPCPSPARKPRGDGAQRMCLYTPFRVPGCASLLPVYGSLAGRLLQSMALFLLTKTILARRADQAVQQRPSQAQVHLRERSWRA